MARKPRVRPAMSADFFPAWKNSKSRNAAAVRSSVTSGYCSKGLRRAGERTTIARPAKKRPEVPRRRRNQRPEARTVAPLNQAER